MFSLKYTIEYNTDPAYPLSKNFGTCLGYLVETEEQANEALDLLALRGTILTVSLDEIKDYKPSKRVVYATTRSWE